MSTASGPLVSVCVITYQSARYVEETLDSIWAQTYANLQLVVSDDGSTDETVAICQRWLAAHADRFESADLLTVPANTGITANANRAFRAGKGEWLKVIAGDDKLLPNCVADYIEFAAAHPKADILFADMTAFGDGLSEQSPERYHRFFTRLSARERWLYLLAYNPYPAPASFVRRRTFEQLGGFDESIPLMEDKPFWIKATSAGTAMDCLDTITVAYRKHAQSVTKDHSHRNKVGPLRRLTNRNSAAFFLDQMKRESRWLWTFGVCHYAKKRFASPWAALLYQLRLVHPYYYYFRRQRRRLGE